MGGFLQVDRGVGPVVQLLDPHTEYTMSRQSRGAGGREKVGKERGERGREKEGKEK